MEDLPSDQIAEIAEAGREEGERQRVLRAEADRSLVPLDRETRYRVANRVLFAAKPRKGAGWSSRAPWLTPEPDAKIVAIYQPEIQWEKEANIKLAVDHVVPLHGSGRGLPYICGPHVPWNLEATPAHLNGKKNNWFPTGGPLIEPQGILFDQHPFNSGDTQLQHSENAYLTVYEYLRNRPRAFKRRPGKPL